MREIKSAAVIGAGALGLLYLEAFSSVRGLRAFFLADGKRAETLEGKEFQINGKARSFQSLPENEVEQPVDLLLVCVKNHHLESISRLVEKACGPETIVISALNGIGSESVLKRQAPRSTVLYCAVLGMDAVKEGDVLSYSRRGKFLLGTGDNKDSPALQSARAFLEKCGLPCELPADIHKELWYKWMINIGINQPSALMGAPYSSFQKEGPARDLMNDAMNETLIIAEAEGVDLNRSDVERWYSVLKTLGPEGKTSMLQDMEAERKTEVESFSGKLIALAEKHGIDVPVNRTLNRIICERELLYLS